MQDNSEAIQSARHLAARAVMAYRAHFPIEFLSNSTGSSAPSGIVSDWKRLRETFGNDDKLIKRAFAFIYIGTIADQNVSEVADALRRELASDQNGALEARQIAVEWGLVRSVMDTNPFAHAGYKLASRLLRSEHTLIESLADELYARGSFDREHLQVWFEEHAEPLAIEELEAVTTY